MKVNNSIENEKYAAQAFGKQSGLFDDLYSSNLTIQYKRERVRNCVNQYLSPNSNILELNAGTGEDSVYFAQQGHKLHATDVSAGMLEKLAEKIKRHDLEYAVSIEQCSFNQLSELKNKGPFDLVFSNFAGLNCTDKLSDILSYLPSILVPNGLVTIVVMPPFCAWELTLALQGNFKAAFRRFNSKKGVTAYVEGMPFTCWYYKPADVVNMVKDNFEVLNVEGLCTLVPPSYFEHFGNKHPQLFSKLKRMEDNLKKKWPWVGIGDYVIMTLRKK